jgi:septum formation protein
MNFDNIRVILASKSPRRRELLGRICTDFEIVTREVDESLPHGVIPKEGVELLAVRKGEIIAHEEIDALVVSSDTLVEIDDVPLGKPCDREDAFRMLRSLSGRAHNVHTGVAVHYRGRCYSGVASSHVYFKELTDGEIWQYIDTGEPMDKAGSYGIQGEGGKFVEKYEGDFDTIMGLSLRLSTELISKALAD